MLYHAQQGIVEAVWGLLQEDNALPLHGFLLAVWITFAGSSEFAARYLSVLFGTLTAPLVLQLGRSLMHRQARGTGVLLAYATLPLFVYYSQEVRMYALAVPLAAAFAWMGWRLVRWQRGGPAYVLLGCLMLVAHLYTGLIWVSVALWGTLSLVLTTPNSQRVALRPRRLLRHRRWWHANLALAAAAIPIAGWALWRSRVDATAVSAIPSDAIRWLPITFGVGQYLFDPWTTLFALVAVMLLVAALFTTLSSGKLRAALWLIVMLTLPVAMLFMLTSVKAKWSERYLLPSWGLALVVGCGVGLETLLRPPVRLGQRRQQSVRLLGLLLLTLWISLTGPALYRQAQGTWAVALQDEWHPRPDFRSVGKYIEAHDTDEDAIAVVGGYALSNLDYYYKGPATLFGLPEDVRTLDTRRVLDLQALEALSRRTADRERLWLVLWQERLTDPTQLVQSALVESCRRLSVDESFTNVGLLLFDLTSCRDLDRLAEPAHPLNVDFAAPIRLEGYDLKRNDTTWEVNLWWMTLGSLDNDYVAFVHLIEPDSSLVDQHDHIAGADAYPTSRWRPETRLRDRFFLEVPGGQCPQCKLRIGLYTSQGRLPLADGRDYVIIDLAQHKVKPAAVSADKP